MEERTGSEKTGFFAVWQPRVLSVLRIAVALLYIEHGTMKLLGYPPSEMFGDLELFSLMGLAGVLELFGSALLIIGLFTRPVAFILSGEMAVAYFMAHAPRGFLPIVNKGEAAAFYSVVFLYFFFAGGGEWSLDELIRRRGQIKS